MDDPFNLRMRARCLEASRVLKFDPACNMVPLFNIYSALARSRQGAEPTVDEIVSAYNMDSSGTAH
jgi:hypothetical protein